MAVLNNESKYEEWGLLVKYTIEAWFVQSLAVVVAFAVPDRVTSL